MVNGAPTWLPNPKSAAGKSRKPTSAPSSTCSCGASRGAIAPIGYEASTVRQIAPGRRACRASATCWTTAVKRLARSCFCRLPSRSDGRIETRCNLSSWYVDPEFRSFGSLLVSVALQAQGRHLCERLSGADIPGRSSRRRDSRRYCEGQFTAFPFLGRPRRDVRLREVTSEEAGGSHPSLPEFELMAAHAGYGCISLVCSGA